MKLGAVGKLRFGINHHGASKPSNVKEKDLNSSAPPEKTKADKKKREKRNQR